MPQTVSDSIMVTYKDLISIPVQDNGEKLISVDASLIPFQYTSHLPPSGEQTEKSMFLREDVCNRLYKAQSLLQKEHPNFSLLLTYGYRTLKLQTERFLEELQKEKVFYADPNDLYEAVHKKVAVPTVAGHPTGGAVDIIIMDRNSKEPIDFGSKQYDYSNKKYYVFSEDISSQAKENRLLLRNVMMSAEFAPFDGEWWHFSYGDKEWAKYYHKPFALYKQI